MSVRCGPRFEALCTVSERAYIGCKPAADNSFQDESPVDRLLKNTLKHFLVLFLLAESANAFLFILAVCLEDVSYASKSCTGTTDSTVIRGEI
jgi:hypothetical protein